MKVYRVFGSMYDLFFGDGWKDWTRVIIRNGEILHKAGKVRSNEVLSKIVVKKG